MELSVYFCLDPILVVVPRLVQRILLQGLNILILCDNEEQMISFDTQIWTFSSKAFLPHGTIHDPWPERQPVLLTTEITNVNQPKVLLDIRSELSLLPESGTDLSNFEKVIHILAAGNTDRQLGLITTYHKQKPTQCWVQDELRKWQALKKD